MHTSRALFAVVGIFGLVLSSGCTSMQSAPTDSGMIVRGNLHSSETPLDPCQFEYGQSAPIVDGIGNIVGIPRKLVLWNRRVKNHQVSTHTDEELRRYVEVNELDDVKVRVNQYAPLDEWRRLGRNDDMHPVWRYTAGTLSMLGYTIFPGRVFGKDNYNPYTNTVSVYSDVPSLGLAELAYAKDIQHAKYPGVYAFSQEFAGLDLIHTTRSTEDAINYLAVHGEVDDLLEGYRVLYPSMGQDVGQSVSSFVPSLDISLGLIGAAAGHVAGRSKAKSVKPPNQ